MSDSPGSSAPELGDLSVDEVQRGFARGIFTCETLVEASLERIAAVDPRYNAMIVLNPDALVDARAIDRRRRAGEPLGPLAGVPVVIKDTMDMAGLPTTGGCASLNATTGGVDMRPATDAPVVARMRRAGAVILGKTNVPLLSHSGNHANDSWAGPTFNAVDRRLLPGGSSTGTATAVAAGLAVLGLAEETGGSIQNPAAAQGLVSVKPTFGLVPNAGVLPLSGLRDVVGPIARRVRDAALALDVLAGSRPADPAAGQGRRPLGGYATGLRPGALHGQRIGLYGPGWRDEPLSEETERLYRRAQDELAAAGAVLVPDPFAGSGFAGLRQPMLPFGSFDVRGLESLPFDIQCYLARHGADAPLKTFSNFLAATAREDPFGAAGVFNYLPHLPAYRACAADPSRPPDMSPFLAAREAYLAVFDEVWRRAGLDALAFPQMRQALGPLNGPDVICETTVDEINIAGLPGVTVPAGAYASGAPFVLLFVGPLWSEAELLASASAYEAMFPHRRAPVLDLG